VRSIEAIKSEHENWKCGNAGNYSLFATIGWWPVWVSDYLYYKLLIVHPMMKVLVINC
jgi:hypothetical protein